MVCVYVEGGGRKLRQLSNSRLLWSFLLRTLPSLRVVLKEWANQVAYYGAASGSVDERAASTSMVLLRNSEHDGVRLGVTSGGEGH